MMPLVGVFQRLYSHVSWIMATRWLVVLGCFLLLLGPTNGAKSRSMKDSCETCTDIVKNINEGIKKTSKSNFGGGNTKWEEQKLGSYEFSETRLVEILESACKESSKQCHSMLEEYEETLERWWFKLYAKDKQRDLQSFFCVNSLKVCCPVGTYGEDCDECDGGKDRPCKGNGKCDGDGTRDGTGECKCDNGYKGDLCDECTENFYQDTDVETHTVCKECDTACKTACEGPGPDQCGDCKDGWTLGDDGCIDNNECEDGPCNENQYCSNNPGSYRCLACDASCVGCNGATATNCVECKDRYYRDDKDNRCRACHVSCAESCTGREANTCDACKEGWNLSEDGYCQDNDECANDPKPCEGDAHCINTQGSYKCSTCHSSCDGCTAAGADKCIACKTGYVRRKDDEMCIDDDECDREDTCPGDNSWCINTPGSYKCDCEAGYMVQDGACVQRKGKKEKKKKAPKKKRKNKDSDDSNSDSDGPTLDDQVPIPRMDEEDMVVMQGDVPGDIPYPDTSGQEFKSTQEIHGEL